MHAFYTTFPATSDQNRDYFLAIDIYTDEAFDEAERCLRSFMFRDPLEEEKRQVKRQRAQRSFSFRNVDPFGGGLL